MNGPSQKRVFPHGPANATVPAGTRGWYNVASVSSQPILHYINVGLRVCARSSAAVIIIFYTVFQEFVDVTFEEE